MDEKTYLNIISYFENCLEENGDSALGHGWPNQKDTETRYRVMLDVIGPTNPMLPEQVHILDFGCGTSRFYDYILEKNIPNIKYSGSDLLPKYIDISRHKHPDVDYYQSNIVDNYSAIPNFDYIIVNGVFTVKRDISFDEMFDYFKSIISILFKKSRKGLAFNVMSKHVDWERDDLFHVSFDLLGSFLRNNISKHFLFRQDYGLYEYTTYVYKEPFI